MKCVLLRKLPRGRKVFWVFLSFFLFALRSLPFGGHLFPLSLSLSVSFSPIVFFFFPSAFLCGFVILHTPPGPFLSGPCFLICGQDKILEKGGGRESVA
ncbi:hypothetical protein CGRA01v4_04021 [Colletotrichum graminicola]|nr:hypothetical protein CGRA01v4_04021 [Colletotrichum graminicola]